MKPWRAHSLSELRYEWGEPATVGTDERLCPGKTTVAARWDYRQNWSKPGQVNANSYTAYGVTNTVGTYTPPSQGTNTYWVELCFGRDDDAEDRPIDTKPFTGGFTAQVISPASRPTIPAEKRPVPAPGAILDGACAQNQPTACFALAQLRYWGFTYKLEWVNGDKASSSVAQDKQQAANLYEKACDLGMAAGCGWAGVIYDNGDGVARDFGRAAKLYQPGCDRGDLRACANLGKLCKDGSGVALDLYKANALFKQSCDANDSYGCGLLGQSYAYGIGLQATSWPIRDMFGRRPEHAASRAPAILSLRSSSVMGTTASRTATKPDPFN